MASADSVCGKLKLSEYWRADLLDHEEGSDQDEQPQQDDDATVTDTPPGQGAHEGRSPRERSTPQPAGVTGSAQSYRQPGHPPDQPAPRRCTRALKTGRARRSADVADRATRRPARTGWCSGTEKNWRRLRVSSVRGDRATTAMGERSRLRMRVLRPGVPPAEQADRGAVALHDGVAAGDDVPQADGHVLRLDHLARVGPGAVAPCGQLGDLAAGEPGEEVHGAEGPRRRRRPSPEGECRCARLSGP